MTKAEEIGKLEAKVSADVLELALAAGLGKHYADEWMDSLMESVTESLMNEGIDPFAEEE